MLSRVEHEKSLITSGPGRLSFRTIMVKSYAIPIFKVNKVQYLLFTCHSGEFFHTPLKKKKQKNIYEISAGALSSARPSMTM